MRDCSDQISMKPGDACWENSPPDCGERGERRVVHRVRRRARHRADGALVQLQADRARHLLVHALHVRVEVPAQRLPPQPRVDEVRPLAVELGLELVLVDRADELLELRVRGEQDRRGRDLVDVAHLQADDAVLDVVDDPDAVARCRSRPPARAGRRSSRRSPLRPTGTPRSNSISTISGSSGASSGPGDELEDVVLRRVVEVLDPLALRGAAPEVVVDRVGRRLGAALDRDAVLARVRDLLVAAHLPAADRRDDLQLGRERRDRRLDADLVVALARAAVGDRVAARSGARSPPPTWR